MISSTSLFENIVCPSEDECIRPNCFYYHCNNDSCEELRASSSSTREPSLQQGSPEFFGYVGYIEKPIDNGESKLATCESESLQSSSACAISSGSIPSKVSQVNAIRRRPIEISVEEILNPKECESTPAACENRVMYFEDKISKMSENKRLQHCVKTVAEIDTRIEVLKRKLELEQNQKHKLVSKYKSIMQTSKEQEYVPTKKSNLVHSLVNTYKGGYTPTPIALLKSKSEKRSTTKFCKGKVGEEQKFTGKNIKKNRIVHNDVNQAAVKNLSMEELFQEESSGRKTKPSSSKVFQASSPEILMKNSISQFKNPSIKQNGQASSVSLNIKKKSAPSASQQFSMRYTNLEGEKPFAQADSLKETPYKPKTSIQSSAVEKGSVRRAHVCKTESNLMYFPLDARSSSKIPVSTRMQYLNKFYQEFLQSGKSNEEAIILARAEEKAVNDRATTTSGYAAGVVSHIRRIRSSVGQGSTKVKTVSHEANLGWKHCDLVRINRSSECQARKQMSEREFYDALSQKYVLSESSLIENGFPMWKDEHNASIVVPQNVVCNSGNAIKSFAVDGDFKRVCCRCGTEFQLSVDGEMKKREQCVYHWARAFKKKVGGSLESSYMCCSSYLNVQGCCIADSHVTNTAWISDLTKFVETQAATGVDDPRSKKVFALDCEMIYTIRGLTLARVTLVDMQDNLSFDVLVKPGYTVLDYNSRFSGLSEELLNTAECDFDEARKRFLELVNAETILIGHSLESDLKALRIVHKKIVDTSVVFPHKKGPPFKRALKNLASEILQLIIQEDVNGHDSKEDSSACMRLMVFKISHS